MQPRLKQNLFSSESKGWVLKHILETFIYRLLASNPYIYETTLQFGLHIILSEKVKCIGLPVSQERPVSSCLILRWQKMTCQYIITLCPMLARMISHLHRKPFISYLLSSSFLVLFFGFSLISDHMYRNGGKGENYMNKFNFSSYFLILMFFIDKKVVYG